jgi:hypothetical protein
MRGGFRLALWWCGGVVVVCQARRHVVGRLSSVGGVVFAGHVLSPGTTRGFLYRYIGENICSQDEVTRDEHS